MGGQRQEIVVEAPGRHVPPALAYGVSLLACLAAGAAGSLLTRPNIAGYYEALQKPGFTPPDAAFPVVWTALYLLMGVAAGRIATRAGSEERRPALALFAVQLVLGVVWSWAFFWRHSPAAGLLTLVILLAAVVATAVAFVRLDRPAGLMLAPLAVWVAYAGALNAAILAMN